jgi:mono/diheme cytochrome c family protein
MKWQRNNMQASAYLIGCAILAIAGRGAAQTFHPDIPRAWDDNEVQHFEVPLAQRDRSPRYITAEEYYALKVRPIYRTYPVYAPGREPAGYMESLKQKESEVVFDASKLRTREDWIRAGEAVFNASLSPSAQIPAGDPITSEGIIPYGRYYIRQKGVVEKGFNSCAACHTRVLPNGTAVIGAQLDVEAEHAVAGFYKQAASSPEGSQQVRDFEWLFSGVPWITPRGDFDKSVTISELARRRQAMQAGVIERQGTSSSHPSHIPSLIGLENIRYFDSTGLMRHRSIADLMRYVIVNYGLDFIAHYGDFQPSPRQLVFGVDAGVDGTRFSDEQLYALALYIYSLQPPPNPNSFDDKARRGQRIFQQQGCAGCHTPPLYTNNKLTPAAGFTVPEDLRKTDDIMNISVGTDPGLATQTRRGTGFYKVPSLRGVWYRNAFSHSGQADTLEEWLDPARLKEDYVPKGFHLAPGPIKGHEFGLKLAPEDKQALIAFLRTL